MQFILARFVGLGYTDGPWWPRCSRWPQDPARKDACFLFQPQPNGNTPLPRLRSERVHSRPAWLVTNGKPLACPCGSVARESPWMPVMVLSRTREVPIEADLYSIDPSDPPSPLAGGFFIALVAPEFGAGAPSRPLRKGRRKRLVGMWANACGDGGSPPSGFQRRSTKRLSAVAPNNGPVFSFLRSRLERFQHPVHTRNNAGSSPASATNYFRSRRPIRRVGGMASLG